MVDDLKDKIKENAEGPKRARGNSGEVEQHDLADQIRPLPRVQKGGQGQAGRTAFHKAHPAGDGLT